MQFKIKQTIKAQPALVVKRTDLFFSLVFYFNSFAKIGDNHKKPVSKAI